MKKYRHIIEQIAKRDLRIDTLEARRSDRLDFHECSVWQIRRALEYAFIAGMMHASFPDANIAARQMTSRGRPMNQIIHGDCIEAMQQPRCRKRRPHRHRSALSRELPRPEWPPRPER